MAIGIFKNTLIYIFLEEDNNKRAEMMERFLEAITQYIVPIKPGRKMKEMLILKIDII